MEVKTFNVHIRATRYKDIYDVRIPELFDEQVFEIMGAFNVIDAVEECCAIMLNSKKFNLQIFSTQSVIKEIIKNTS